MCVCGQRRHRTVLGSTERPWLRRCNRKITPVSQSQPQYYTTTTIKKPEYSLYKYALHVLHTNVYVNVCVCVVALGLAITQAPSNHTSIPLHHDDDGLLSFLHCGTHLNFSFYHSISSPSLSLTLSLTLSLLLTLSFFVNLRLCTWLIVYVSSPTSWIAGRGELMMMVFNENAQCLR